MSTNDFTVGHTKVRCKQPPKEEEEGGGFDSGYGGGKDHKGTGDPAWDNYPTGASMEAAVTAAPAAPAAITTGPSGSDDAW